MPTDPTQDREPAQPSRIASRIEGGIEWFTWSRGGIPDVRDPWEEEGCQCARCGSSVSWIDCQWCDEDGYEGHDCGEDCCACLHPEPNIVCSVCDGTRGWHSCLSSPEWCNANPMPGREHIQTTAMKAEAWHD